MIDRYTSATMYYTSRRCGGISLNRPHNVTSPTGRFCCKVFDETLCVIIGKHNLLMQLTFYEYVTYYTDAVSITPFQGSSIAGENYTVECSIGGTVATFEWLVIGPDNRTLLVDSSFFAISSNSSTSQLQFRPLQQFHNGSYSCRATTDEETLSSVPIEISVNCKKNLV